MRTALTHFRVVLVGIFILTVQLSEASRKYSPPPLEDIPVVTAAEEDPHIKTSWHLDHIGVFDAWKTTMGSRAVRIAVVDSGVDYNNPDLAHAIYRNEGDCVINRKDDDNNGFVDDCIGMNYSEWHQMPWDDNGHGTFIAGILVAAYNNGIGGAGVCPGCSLVPLRFLDKEGFGDTEDAIRGIEYAARTKVSVLSLSFAGEGYDQPLRNALKEALANDVVVIAAAGNDGENNDVEDTYPANFHMPNLITVAASRRDNDLWIDSNYGARNVTIAAPGTTIWGPWVDGKWYRSQGTSFAAPVVAGVVGLIRSANPSLSAPTVVEIVKRTATPSKHLTRKVQVGGVINARAAVACAIDPQLSCLPKSRAR